VWQDARHCVAGVTHEHIVLLCVGANEGGAPGAGLNTNNAASHLVQTVEDDDAEYVPASQWVQTVEAAATNY
jgi:hypothetical protein